MSALDEFSQSYHDHFTRNPNACAELGVPRRLDELPDPSLADAEDRVREARELLARLDTVDRGALDFDDALDADLARLALEAEVHRETYTFNGRTQLQQLPSAGQDVGDGIFYLFINDPRPVEERLANVTARLEAVPDYVEALLGRLDTPVERWVAIDAERVEGLPQLFATLSGWAEEVGWADRPRLEVARRAAESALEGYLQRLRSLPTTRQLHVGEETARRIVALRGVDKPLQELHAIARDFLARTRATIDELRRSLVARYDLDPATDVAGLQGFLAQRFRVELPNGALEDVLARYQAEREKILAFISERDLFPVFDEQDMKILRTPGFMEPSIPAGAMMSPAPFREGVRTSLVYLTLSEELLDEHTELSIPSMMIHEGIPGHHLQLATASTHPSIIRRHADAMDQAEGWTTMLEDYMLDQGYLGERTDEARFIGKRDINRIGARVAIDLFFMTGERGYLDVGVDCDLSPDDPFEAAGNLLQAVTGFVPGRVQAELNWYSQERGYPLSYLTGNTLVWELKRDVEAAQRGRLEDLELDRAFHRVYLEAGNMPVSFLRRVYRHQGLLG